MRYEDHLNAYREHRLAIFEWALRVRGLVNAQRIVGLHASRSVVELLSADLHLKNLITSGAQINHRWFKSKTVLERLPTFPDREAVVDLMVELEDQSENLAYGAPKEQGDIERVLELFTNIESRILGLDGGWSDEQV
ncbi:MAG: hypothetical protein QF415_02585 [Candidatus Undinarchaeales archaeon]|jgi:hypothetical protein|nr:hypothetical protein [Candidatus Undinarchaeales archaeon]MDP7492292.1 hypothetical protein [Candidatus Undinarchaeales archaeon]